MKIPSSFLAIFVSTVLAAALGLAPAGLQAQTAGPKVLKKVPPEFPNEAQQKGITEGVLKARLSVDATGAITDVAILEATPTKAKVFNEAAIVALKQWKFEGSGKPQNFELKLVFAQD